MSKQTVAIQEGCRKDGRKDVEKTAGFLNIGVWNVEGMSGVRRCKIDNKDFRDTLTKYDLLLSTETWTDPNSNLDLQGYTRHSLHRLGKKQKTSRNSDGLAIYSRSNLADGISVLKTDSDDIIWLKLSKVFSGFDKDIYCCLCYAVPIDSLRQDLITEDISDRILDDISQFNQNEDVYYMLTGDFIART